VACHKCFLHDNCRLNRNVNKHFFAMACSFSLAAVTGIGTYKFRAMPSRASPLWKPTVVENTDSFITGYRFCLGKTREFVTGYCF
jgi:hypothetical protein